MWFALAIAAAAFVVAALFAPKPKIENARSASLDDFSFPRSDEGDPVPIVKGTTRMMSPNTIWIGAFRSQAITEKVKTGLFSSKNQIVGYKYFIGLNLALALGPGIRLKRIWFGEKVVWTAGEGGTHRIEVWKDANYGSKSLVFTSAVANLNGIGLNDGISSFRALGQWELFEHANFAGASIIVEGSNPNLAGTPFQDKISSMRPVAGAPGVVGNKIVGGIDIPDFHGTDSQNGGISGTFAFYGGSMDQEQDPYLMEKIGEKVPAYHGISHIVFEDFYVGNSPNLEAMSFELECLTDKLGLGNGHTVMPNGKDENPIETLYDLYTTFWGKLGVDPANIDIANFREAAERIYTENNGYSLSLANANTGADLTKEIIRQINAILYQDIETAKIRIKLIRRDYNVATLPVLRPTNILELRNYTKQLWDETYNQVRVKYRNRENNYKDGSALWQDFANINMQQRVRSTDMSFPGVYNGDLANELAAREGAELNVPLFQCEFDADRTTSELRPGDCFILHWPEYGIKRTVMRIRKFDTGELTNGKIGVMCVQDEFSSDTAVFSTPALSQWTPPDLTPDALTTYAVFAAPAYFKRVAEGDAATGERLFALVRRPDAQSQSYNIHTSLDAFNNAALSGEQVQFAGAGELEGAYPATAGAATGLDDSLGIVVADLDGVFLPQTYDDAEIKGLGQNLLYVGGEIMGYRTVTDNGDGTYLLTNIRRGLLDTGILAHADGAKVFFLSSIDGMTPAIFAATDTPTVKLQDIAPQGVYPLQDAAVIGPISISSRAERPAPPVHATYAGVRTGSASASATGALAWRERNRNDKTVWFRDDPTQPVETGQDNEVKWRINAGAWTTVYVTGASTTINTSAALDGDTLSVEVRSRRDGLFSRVADTFQITLTVP